MNMLLEKKITLLDPSGWDDRNDAYFLDAYRKKVSAKHVYALCFTEAQQKYHHWSVFASGADGVCISFNKSKLIRSVKDAGSFEFKQVKYMSATKAERELPFTNDDLKFTKHLRYSDEKEWRLLYTDYKGVTSNPTIPFTFESIYRITLSPWLAKPLVPSLRKVIKSLPECRLLSVRRSTLIDYANWKTIADKSV
ncbi:MAG TPA: DUF2971 domain-containing protein [Rhodobacteraceae bacterium]|nr:DUF2971 domain-containing protein [Paracoccaceae bacterium]